MAFLLNVGAIAGASQAQPLVTSKPTLNPTPEPRKAIAQTTVEKSNDLSKNKNVDAWLANSFKFFLAPLSVLSCVTSLTTFAKGENAGSLETASNWINKAAYFFNGIYGAINNSSKNNLIGAAGYSIVSLASIFGNEENMYLFKGPGSALDQMPAMLDDLRYNPEIKKQYNIKEGKEEEFNVHPNILDNIEKTISGVKVTFSDIYNEFIAKKSNGAFNAIWDIFVKDERKAEKNLLISTIGILAGSAIGIPFEKFRTLGSVIRDVFGFHADLALVAKFKSIAKNVKEKTSNSLYGFSGVFYTLGSGVDLIYRLFKTPKLNIAAVGLDNAGFVFMNGANWWSSKKAAEEKETKLEQTNTTQTVNPGLALASN